MIAALVPTGVLAAVQSPPGSGQVEDGDNCSDDSEDEPPGNHSNDPEGLPCRRHRGSGTSGHVDHAPDDDGERRKFNEKQQSMAHGSSFRRNPCRSNVRDERRPRSQLRCRTSEPCQNGINFYAKIAGSTPGRGGTNRMAREWGRASAQACASSGWAAHAPGPLWGIARWNRPGAEGVVSSLPGGGGGVGDPATDALRQGLESSAPRSG